MLEFIATIIILKLQLQSIQDYILVYQYDQRVVEELIYDRKNFYKYAPTVVEEATEYGIEPELAIAVVLVESKFKPTAGSHRGAYGLMQLMPITAEEMNIQSRYDPVENIAGGVGYLSRMIDRFEDHELALAAYNAGPGNVLIHNGIPPYVETENYVDKVTHLYDLLKSP